MKKSKIQNGLKFSKFEIVTYLLFAFCYLIFEKTD
jgi:hypothetical protein